MNQMQYQPNMSLQTPEERQMGLILHLSQLANLILPPAGLIIPIVLWQTKKNEMPGLDAHGKMVTNWIISSTIYYVISFIIFFIGLVLTLIFIGIFISFLAVLMIMAIGLASMIFAVIGGVKANNGELWEYPGTIKFLK